MRKVPLAGAVAAVVLGVAGVVSMSATSQAAEPSPVKSETLVFRVVFSPFELVQANNVRNPSSPFALGDVVVFLTRDLPNNCSSVIRLPGGDITTQFSTSPGPAPKPLALTGGTGIYRNIGGDGTLVEFGSVHGKLTLHVLSLVARG